MANGGKDNQALYRKYRSKSLDEILGQDHITGLLKQALKKGKISHAYLLTGPRGTGKTSIARILAHEINQLPYDEEATHLDIIEIDAASNNGVDDVRALREKAQIAPVSAKYKVYIIDEVHMLSKPAFNALLKTLEEPPEHVVFILATTNADKLPSTIISRVQQYYFRPISNQIIIKQLQKIAKAEGFLLDEEAASLIAEQSKGGFRDSISLLDQLSSLASSKQPLTQEQVSKSIGLTDSRYIDNLIDAYDKELSSEVLSILNQLNSQGVDSTILINQLLSRLRHQLVERPDFTKLIARLIEAAESAHPDLKLLTVLMTDTSQAKSTTVTNYPEAVEQPKPTYSQPDQATIDTPKEEETKKEEKKEATPSNPADDSPIAEAEKPPKASKPKGPKPTAVDFDWAKVLDCVKQESSSLLGFISSCDHEYKDSTLTIYAGKDFNKKQIESNRNRPLLAEAVQKSCGVELDIVIKNGHKPPEDEKIADVVEIMGGGVEVKLEEVS